MTTPVLLAAAFTLEQFKLRRNRNPERAEGFTAALRAVRAAADHHFNAEYQAGEALIWEAVHALREGNRRRKRASGSQ